MHDVPHLVQDRVDVVGGAVDLVTPRRAGRVRRSRASCRARRDARRSDGVNRNRGSSSPVVSMRTTRSVPSASTTSAGASSSAACGVIATATGSSREAVAR